MKFKDIQDLQDAIKRLKEACSLPADASDNTLSVSLKGERYRTYIAKCRQKNRIDIQTLYDRFGSDTDLFFYVVSGRGVVPARPPIVGGPPYEQLYWRYREAREINERFIDKCGELSERKKNNNNSDAPFDNKGDRGGAAGQG